MAVGDHSVPLPEVPQEVIRLDDVSVHRDAAAHHVVGDVRDMVCGRDLVTGALKGVGASHDLGERQRSAPDRLGEGAVLGGHPVEIADE